jgi:hypothetical protein
VAGALRLGRFCVIAPSEPDLAGLNARLAQVLGAAGQAGEVASREPALGATRASCVPMRSRTLL